MSTAHTQRQLAARFGLTHYKAGQVLAVLEKHLITAGKGGRYLLLPESAVPLFVTEAHRRGFLKEAK